MTTPTRILVAVDYSTRPNAVCRAGADLAARLGAHVTLLSVVAMPSGVPEDAMVVAEGDESPRPAGEALERDAKEHLQPLVEFFAEKGVEAEVCCRHGEVVQTIHACADELDALFIVTGADVPGGLKRLVRAGFTASIIRAASRPVLVVPPDDEQMRGQSHVQGQVASEADG